MTEFLFRDDAYRREATAHVLGVSEHGAIHLDRTIFYAASGGQPGDCGVIFRKDGTPIPIATTVFEADKLTIAHVMAEGAPRPEPGEKVSMQID